MKYDKDLLSCGFKVLVSDMKNKSTKELILLINERHDLLDAIQQQFNQETVVAIQESNAQILALCTHYGLEIDPKVAIDRINNIVTHIIQENAMKTSESEKKAEPKTSRTKPKTKANIVQESVEPKPEVKTVAKPEKPEKAEKTEKPVSKKASKAETAKAESKAEAKTPEKAPSSPAPEPKKAEAATTAPEPKKAEDAKPAPEFKTPCGGIFDPDPSSSCFGMCKDESPEDFELCMNHYKSALEAKTNRRRAASRATSEKSISGVKKSPKRFDRIGDGLGTSAHMINIMLLEGATIEEMMDVIPTERTRIMGHLSGLKTGNGHRKPKTIIKDPTTKRYYLEVEEGEPCTYFTIC